MALGRTTRWLLVGVVGLVLLAPVWGFELLYHWGLSGEVLPGPPESEVPPLMRQALWVASGEEPNTGVRALWVGNFFDRSPTGGEPSSPGRHAVADVAVLLVYRTPERQLRHLEHHLITSAVAVWLSRHATESELKQYVAEWQYFGRGARGVEAAATAYFGKRVSELTVAQVAMIAGLPQSPSRYGCNPERAVKRRDFILKRLRDVGAITPAELTVALGEPLVTSPPAEPCAEPRP
jgi:penicillin-binding protein 1A